MCTVANGAIYKVSRDQEHGLGVKPWLCRVLAVRPGAGNCASASFGLLIRKRVCCEEQTNVLM